ncbi:hypothetical protein FFA01_06400 [Frigoribacterium faeni]|uniref:Uncharacterized protein n=1 Tax=Frigoribacterium faeni TaxID=145483 RepID=A0ABQ0ULH2_9MICO|nr:hypothetical protein GCM10025699_50690 [Microbacterium flavescens]GEK82331.1 hypothetical protein FFA01_06400 [Frigoribacterium faeni]
MWPFRRKAPPRTDVFEAQEAKRAATTDLEKVESQTEEVRQIVNSLERRRIKNNFGDALVIAMEARK